MPAGMDGRYTNRCFSGIVNLIHGDYTHDGLEPVQDHYSKVLALLRRLHVWRTPSITVSNIS